MGGMFQFESVVTLYLKIERKGIQINKVQELTREGFESLKAL
jgi:hypothetical protein